MIDRPRGAPALIGSALAAVAVAACGGTETVRIDLVIVLDDCGLSPPPNAAATTIELTALADTGADRVVLSTTDTPVDITSFGPETRQLALEVRDAGATVLTLGKTAPFVVEGAPAQLPISLLPPDTMCAVGSLAAARRRPSVIPVGDGALVVGGSDATGAVHSLEYFDPLTNGFTPIDQPEVPTGFTGGLIVTLSDGRILLTGGDRGNYVVFDPVQRTFDRPGVLPNRALAAAVALDDRRVLIAGGCPQLTDGLCDHNAVATVGILDVDAGTTEPLANLARPRAGGIAMFEPGPDGTTVIAIAGGVDGNGQPATDIERIALDTGIAVDVTSGAPGLPAMLDSGSLLLALAPAGSSDATDAGAVAVPGQPAAQLIAPAPRIRRDAALVPLEDGTVLAIGGVDGPQPDDPPGQLMLYRPIQGWEATGGTLATPILEHGAARLADGSVLVVGGVDRNTGAPLATAWRYRPPLLGPLSAAAVVTPASASLQLVPLAPSQVDHAGGGFTLIATATLDNFAVIGGPHLADGTLDATLAITDGGFGLIARSAGAGDRIEAVLDPGKQARVERWIAGVPATICTGREVPPFGADPFHAVMTIDRDSVSVRRGQEPPDIDGCDLGSSTTGLWGVAASAGDIGSAHVRIATIGVER